MNSLPFPTALDDPKLRKELECSICLHLFEDPRQLACGHVFCRNCVSPLIENTNKSTNPNIKCPLCRGETVVPLDRELPAAIVVKNSIEHFNKGRRTEPLNNCKKATINPSASPKMSDNVSATNHKINTNTILLCPEVLVTSQPEPSGGFNSNNPPMAVGCTGRREFEQREECDCCSCNDECCGELIGVCIVECCCRLFCAALTGGCNNAD